MAKATIWMIIGTGLGLFVAHLSQIKLNHIEAARCKNLDAHRLVSIRSAVGLASYCLPSYYLNGSQSLKS
jgi:hypothetical protein